MALDAGKLRHKVSIQQNIETQQSDGSMVPSWVDVYPKLYAEIAPLSAREFLASGTQEMGIQTRITIRYKKNIKAKMRLLHGDTIYNIESILPDPLSGMEYLTLLCSSGVIEDGRSHG